MGITLFAAALLAAPMVQDVEQPAAADSACELHVWPGSSLGSVYHGWFHGGIVNGAVTGRDGYPPVPPNPIDTAAQVDLLAAAKPEQLLQLNGYKLVMHDEALSSRVIRGSTGRIATSAAVCYAELMVDDVFFQQDAVNGGFLKVSFRFRQFGAAPAPQRAFGTWVKTRLLKFPPKQPQDTDPAVAELRQAFVANISLFANAVLKPAKTR